MLNFFQSVPGVHITAGDVCDYFKSQGIAIGQSTVYRHLESLVDDGIITKYYIDTNSPACFEYVEPASHADADVCYHCICEKCGKLIHLHCEEVKALQDHMFEHHQFKMDPMRTVFYGLCDQCM